MTPLPAYDAGDPAAYVASRLALVGDRDPVPLLAAAPDRIADAVTHLSDNAARRPEEKTRPPLEEENEARAAKEAENFVITPFFLG